MAQGEVVQRGTVSQLETLRTLLGPEQPRARVALEACREAWFVHDRLVEWGNEVVLVDTTRSRRLGIGQHGRKTDRIDAEVLARALGQGGIPVAHVLSPARRKLREVLSVRRALVQTRAELVTTVRGIARAQGTMLSRCTTDCFVGKVRAAKLPQELAELIEPLLATITTVEAQLARADLLGPRSCPWLADSRT